MIKASHLSKLYKKTKAVDDISFQVETGKVTGFLGPNGAGKSTTMRLMLGIDNGSGTTTFEGKKLSDYQDPSTMVGILLEAKAFHPTRTARNHLSILARAGNVDLKRVDEVLEIVGLSEVAKKGPGKFSLGMSQRLGLAAAILSNPKYLILDEPANGLDPEGIVWLREFLKDYADKGNAVFVSSHLLNEMAVMADNVIVIGRGKLIADTSIKELIASNTSSSVYVRSSDNKKLAGLLATKKIDLKNVDAGIDVFNSKTDAVGKLAFQSGITIFELTQKNASLEEVFLDLTEGQDQFHGKNSEAKK